MNDLLYVCSPYRGDTKRNKGLCTQADKGSYKQWLCPGHGAFILDGSYRRPEPGREKPGHGSGMKILENCKYILIGDKYGVSDGMKAEMTLAALKRKSHAV